MKLVIKRALRWLIWKLGFIQFISRNVNSIDNPGKLGAKMTYEFYEETLRLYPDRKQIPVWLAKNIEYELSAIIGLLIRDKLYGGGKIVSLPKYPHERVYKYKLAVERLIGREIYSPPVDSLTIRGVNCRDLGITVTGRKLLTLLNEILLKTP